MRYLKVFTDFAEVIEPINDAEAGRLFRAMLKYAATGETPQFGGNERYIWPTAKLNIDREAAFCEKQRRNANGGKDKEPTIANKSQQEPTGAKGSQTSHKDKDNDKEETYLYVPPSFVSSLSKPNSDELERMIDRLNLDLYEGEDQRLAAAIEDAIRAMYIASRIKVGGQWISQGAVRSVLKSLTIDHIDYIMAKLADQPEDEPVTNGRAYLMACIYNAPADCAVNNKRQSWR